MPAKLARNLLKVKIECKIIEYRFALKVNNFPVVRWNLWMHTGINYMPPFYVEE